MNAARSARDGLKMAGLVLFVSAAAAVAASAHGGDTSRIHACVNKSSGRIRIVAPHESCRPSERPLDWNIVGPPGPPGPSFLQVVLRENEQRITVAPGDLVPVSSACQAGEVVLGGGPTLSPASLVIRHSTLFFTGTTSGWTVGFENQRATPVVETVAVSATCTAGAMSRD